MSFKRRGCILHRKLINLFQCKNDPDYLIDTQVNSKAIHATIVYNRWQNKKVKQIHSHRLGISYKSQYETPTFIVHARPERRMYRKRIYDLQTHHASDSKTHKKQKLRFERACKAVFHRRGTRVDTQAPAINIKDQMRRAGIHRFLFLPSQHIHKPIQHLKFHRTFRSMNFPYYNFPIPSRLKRPSTKKKKLLSNSSSSLISPTQHIPQKPSEEIMYTHDLPAITIQPIPSDDRNTWHNKLGFLIPNDLLPYVTEDPIYTSKTQEKIKGRTHEPERRRELSLRAQFWGTSSYTLELRESMVSDLTYFQNHVHKEITKMTKRRKFLQTKLDNNQYVSTNTLRLEQLELEFDQFKIDYRSVIDTRAVHHRLKGDTSDDTKELEFRPNKRSDIMSLDNNRQMGPVKKLRSDLSITEDVNTSIIHD
ncbi:hypothetical protein RhiirA5_415672 [Rhizophagus irregularis]|uniref:DUF8211 domain-containing protein n=1 Tax=Rhizophagus irregularis TaxID=588596 RepID=A0A2N0PRI3_9GLOM|nr:hypothetical protein RhiirA5_415672 [Rhizophagus irregularis]CAB5185044.1 unnamed protein product [Rhizophagus irregularis]